jgi:hypothetical protein
MPKARQAFQRAGTWAQKTGAGLGDEAGFFEKFGGKARGIGGSILGLMILQRLLNLPSEVGERNVRQEALHQQREFATPENIYYQAALPRAQEEESMARQALFARLSGGVLGPSLASGERLIGGGR